VERPPISRSPIRPDRLRRIDGQSFAFLPHRLLRDGFLSSLRPDEQRLYLFLVLAADRDGISFYSCDRIGSILEMVLDDYIDARNGLLAKDLIAFDGARFQVLSLPGAPVYPPAPALRTSAQLGDHDPATVRQIILASLPRPGRGSRTSR
jgi:hypothetical protein